MPARKRRKIKADPEPVAQDQPQAGRSEPSETKIEIKPEVSVATSGDMKLRMFVGAHVSAAGVFISTVMLLLHVVADQK